MSNLLFAKVHLPVLNKERAVEEILSVSESEWFWDSYRATSMLPLMTRGGQGKVTGATNKQAVNFEWLPFTPKVVSDWFDTVVFPWMGTKTRVMALLTQPHFENKEHIDCAPHEMGSLQHKFRIVLQGNTNTLYWKTSQGDVAVPDIRESFLMDGSWPHGMRNASDTFKLTLAAGAPWNGNPHYDNVDVMMDADSYLLPKYIDQFFK